MNESTDILLIFVGQAGINIAERFWKYVYETLNIEIPSKFKENGNIIDRQLDEKFNMTEYYSNYEIEEARRMFFFNLLDEHDRESKKPKKYIPRTIFIDIEAEPIRHFAKKNSHIFPKESFIYDTYGSHSMYARAKRLGKNLEPKLLERINNLISTRAIQNLEGIIIVHATGGGAGSGLLSNIFQVLREEFNKTPILNFSIYPSPKISGNVVEAYNTIYATSILLEKSDATIVIDNDQIIELIKEKYDISSPTFEDINLIISRLIFSILMQLAMPGAIIRMDFNKLFTNLVPYKYMKFLMTGIAPFKFDDFSQNKTEEMINEITDEKNYLANVDFATGKYCSIIYLFIGEVGPEVKTPLRIAKENMDFMPWIPTGIFTAITPRENMTLDGKNLKRQVKSIANNSAIRYIFERILRQFTLMMDKKAFLVHYKKENIDSEKELLKSAENVKRIIKFYAIAEKTPGKN